MNDLWQSTSYRAINGGLCPLHCVFFLLKHYNCFAKCQSVLYFKFLQVTVSTSKSYHVNNVPFFSGKEQFCLLWRGVLKTRGDFQSIQLKKWQESVVLYEKSIVDWIKNLRSQWVFAGEKFYWRFSVKDNQQTFSR
jgi:hypothetical protein